MSYAVSILGHLSLGSPDLAPHCEIWITFQHLQAGLQSSDSWSQECSSQENYGQTVESLQYLASNV